MCAQVELPPPSGLVSPAPFILLSLLQHFFTSFGARDRCFLLIFRLWQNALLEKVGLGESWTRGLEVGLGRGDHGARDARTRGTPPALPHGQQVQRTCSFSIGHPPLPRGPPRAPVPCILGAVSHSIHCVLLSGKGAEQEMRKLTLNLFYRLRSLVPADSTPKDQERCPHYRVT